MNYGLPGVFDQSYHIDVGLDDYFDFFAQSDTISIKSSAEVALNALQEHFRFSRASSPRLRQDSTRWLLATPSLQNFDRDVVNIFLSLFMRHVAPTFTSFMGFEINSGVTSEKVLAMAAVGGLFCASEGSLLMSKAMIGDSRRLAYARVINDDVLLQI